MLATLNRATLAETCTDLKIEKVRRCLFGVPDSLELRLELTRQLADIAKHNQDKWNFDFAEEIPKNGRYEWQVTQASDFAETKENAVRTPMKGQESQRFDVTHAEKLMSTPVCCRLGSPSVNGNDASNACKGTGTNIRITDFFTSKKRLNSTPPKASKRKSCFLESPSDVVLQIKSGRKLRQH